MFMRLERKEQECDELKKKIEQLENRGYREKPLIETNKTYIASQLMNYADSQNNNVNKYKENIAEPKKDQVKDNINNFFQPTQDMKANTTSTSSKPSALVRLYFN